MLSNIWTIIKKELRRIFTDKRMLAGLILPGVLIYLIYSLMGNMMTEKFTPKTDYEYKVVIFNQPQMMTPLNSSSEYKIKLVEEETIENAKDLLSKNEVELVIVYDENFETSMATGNPPNILVYFNSTSNESNTIYTYYLTNLSMYSVNTYNFLINSKADEVFDLATNEDTSVMIIKMLVPFLLVIFLFSGCMAVATESIAGEKERGTIATLLVTPVKRRDIALGKVASLAIAAFLSSISSFLGVILSFPKMVGGIEGMTLSMYNALTYIEIFALMIVTVLLFTVILSVISTFAKSVKEASQYAMPVMVVVMMLAIPSMMGSGFTDIYPMYLIPVLNVMQTMMAIFSMEFNLLNFLTTIVSNIIYVGIGIYVLTKMFNSEKIIFNK